MALVIDNKGDRKALHYRASFSANALPAKELTKAWGLGLGIRPAGDQASSLKPQGGWVDLRGTSGERAVRG